MFKLLSLNLLISSNLAFVHDASCSKGKVKVHIFVTELFDIEN